MTGYPDPTLASTKRPSLPPWHQIVILLHQIILILNLHRNNRCLYLFLFSLALDSLFRCRFGVVFSGKNLGGEVRLLVFGRREDDKKNRIRSGYPRILVLFHGLQDLEYQELADTDPETEMTDPPVTDTDPDTSKIPDIWIRNRPI
ncbi:unnamed protein product [Arabidopsis thaliana]|uniref:Transmembrane protein n=1 Tax=Arabidopsis thaliana TaxID=3702 RepID=A0A5S9WMK8_ARATH|nr:unnamed protein product [Arabidopsis thaliana]